MKKQIVVLSAISALILGALIFLAVDPFEFPSTPSPSSTPYTPTITPSYPVPPLPTPKFEPVKPSDFKIKQSPRATQNKTIPCPVPTTPTKTPSE